MPKFPSQEESQTILDTVVSGDGLYKFDNFLTDEEVESLREEMESQFSELNTGDEYCCDGTVTPGSYPFGKICRIQRHNLNRFPSMLNVLNNAWFSIMADAYYYGNANKLLQVFFSHEYLLPNQVDGVTRNSVLHFDPFQAFKFMIYITDCEKETGAFRYIKGSQIESKKIRNLYQMHELLNDKYTLESNPSMGYSEDDVVYAEASKGSLLIFDTDIIHGGGILQEEGSERMAIIVHNRRG